MTNSISLVYSVIELLRQAEINTVLFGGWAEELSKSITPRPHYDIDLLLFADNFSAVDFFLEKNLQVSEIREKRYSHKRAFLINGVMVELFLVQKEGNVCYTNFWDHLKLKWPSFKYQSVWYPKLGFVKIVDPSVIDFYRSNQLLIDSARKKYCPISYIK